MIVSYADPETKLIGSGRRSRRLPADIQIVAARKLAQLDAATTLQDLKAPPGNRLEALKGSRSHQHSIRINGQWRIVFVWTQQGPRDVQIVDYH